MKKIILMVTMMLTFVFTSCQTREHEIINFDKLPSKAQSFIKDNFGDFIILQIEKDFELFGSEYTVYFKEGSKIEFDRKGEWSEIEVKTGIPSKIILESILNYINENHPDNFIIEISKDKKDYEVELNNSLDLVFDLKGKFLRYDD